MPLCLDIISTINLMHINLTWLALVQYLLSICSPLCAFAVHSLFTRSIYMAIGEYFLCSIKMSNYPHRGAGQIHSINAPTPRLELRLYKKTSEKRLKRTLTETQIRDQKFSHEATQNQADYTAQNFGFKKLYNELATGTTAAAGKPLKMCG